MIMPDAIGFLAGANDLSAQLLAATLPQERAKSAPRLIVGQRIDAALVLLFAALLWVVIIDMLRVSLRFVRGRPVLPLAAHPGAGLARPGCCCARPRSTARSSPLID